jgi:hypothetical protein
MQSTNSELKKICDTMFPATWYQKNTNTYQHATLFDIVSLQNPSGTGAHYSQCAAEH